MTISFMIKLFKIIKGNIIIVVAKHSRKILRFTVSLLYLTKSSKYFLYNLELLSFFSNFGDDFVKQNKASSKSGVVGSSGTTTPMHPSKKDKIPIIRKKIFIIIVPLI